jgi:hypothetical protein
LDNSPKFELAMIFMNVNLDGFTCMQNFEATTEVAIGLLWKYIQIGLGFEFIFKQSLHATNIVYILWGYCRCYSDTRGVTLLEWDEVVGRHAIRLV